MDTQSLRGADGVRISVQVSGDPGGPPVVLLHALGDRAEDWGDVAAALGEDFRVLAVDLRGHGNSGRPGEYSFELMRDDVVAYLVAMDQPDRVARLVIEDAPPPYPRTRALPERPTDDALPFDWAVVPAIAGQVNDPSRRWWTGLPGITASTLLIGGGAASHIPQELLAEVPGLIPDCTLVTLEAGHNIHRTAPEQFISTVTEWLGERAL